MSDNEIIKKLIEHDDKFDKLVTKSEFNEFKDSFFQGQDQMMAILTRLDQERVFTVERIKRIEKKVEDQQIELMQIKKVLKIA